jgi:hypothetical protein
VYAINAPATSGTNSALGCRDGMVTYGPSPIGAVDAVSGAAGQLHVIGWAADPETTAPIDVHVYVDGAFVVVAPAIGPRPDVALALPELGGAHGFDAAMPMPATGTHDVCVYGLNASGTAGENQLVACKKVSISP